MRNNSPFNVLGIDVRGVEKKVHTVEKGQTRCFTDGGPTVDIVPEWCCTETVEVRF